VSRLLLGRRQATIIVKITIEVMKTMVDRQMQIAADNETRRGNYSNLALISHRKEEFVIDFLFIDPQSQTAKADQALLASRIVLNPGHMKRLYQAIGENIERYEKNFGKIILPPTLK
jgi:hypothetical protein